MAFYGVKRLVYRAFCRMVFSEQWQYRFDRQVFFNRAFAALAMNGIQGDYVEFGSHGCRTFSMAYEESRRKGIAPRLWAFDSFKGLPESSESKDQHPRWGAGDMATPLDVFDHLCRREGIPKSEYRVVPGYYSESLPGIVDGDEPREICLAYVDCDLYSSTKEVLGFLSSRIRHGMIIAFDDWHLWSSNAQSGEKSAFEEFCLSQTKWKFQPYLPIGWHGLSFVVELAGC